MHPTKSKTMQRDQGEQSMPIVGIDLGTTNSAIAVLDGRVPVAGDTNGQYILPRSYTLLHRTRSLSDLKPRLPRWLCRHRQYGERHMGQDESFVGPHRLLPKKLQH